ncbi:uncharacterized protein KD926_000834 [Aspergillus affinis]|uniref:uncharacterized protein n=1 Tax=Aspergillus affinis TaxID=1070780 RepID=UPI0022FDDB99|nr:uncharacterized protein KD926_000834 [Aspergillus affinis]KAI9037117.1 hypothetical protein KD926_000834 [Aspergillus affinis]
MQPSLSTSTTGFSPVKISISGGSLGALILVEAKAKGLNNSFARSSDVAKSIDDYDTYGIKEPTGRLHTIKAFTEGKLEQTVADIMSRHPERTANMLLSMSAMASQYPHTGFYDFSWVVPRGKEDTNRTLIVDIGGAKDWTLQAICKEAPEILISRCVLQDLPVVIQLVKTVGDGDIRNAQLMAIDFHKEQPVNGTLRLPHAESIQLIGLGALVYMMRRILRDFGDDECVSILQHVVDAMALDSKLLIADTVTGNPPSWFPSMLDFFSPPSEARNEQKRTSGRLPHGQD